MPARVRCIFSISLGSQMGEEVAGRSRGGLPPDPAPGLVSNPVASHAATRSWQAVARVLRSPLFFVQAAAGDLVTTVFPGDCRVCAQPLAHLSAVPVCLPCLEGLEPRAHTGCRRCGDRLDLAEDMEDLSFRGMECLSCRLVPPDFTRAVAFGTYEGSLRELIHLLKYERMSALSRVLGERLADAMLTLRHEVTDDPLVIAVPLFASAERRRGYNQARLLADQALRLLGKTAPDWHLTPAHETLTRVKGTAHQFALSRRARRQNLSGAFAVASAESGRIKGREIILIDDILTTGATARECARVLRRAGAAQVWVATVARACGADGDNHAEHHDPHQAVARWSSPVQEQQRHIPPGRTAHA